MGRHWLFTLCGWVGQDYFSPQGFTYLLYLAFVAILLVWFRAPRRCGRRRRPGEAEVRPAAARRLAVLLAVLIALFAASRRRPPAHPVRDARGASPPSCCVGRSKLPGLPLLFAVLVVGWVGFLAEPYWSGHFDDLFGGVGGVGGNVSSSVSGRIQGGSSTHKLVLYTRVLLAGGVMACACWGWWRRREHGYRGAVAARADLRAVPRLRHAVLRRRDGAAGLHVRRAGRRPAGRARALPAHRCDRRRNARRTG